MMPYHPNCSGDFPGEMINSHTKRRYFAAIQSLFAILAILALLGTSGVYGAHPAALASVAGYLDGTDVQLDLRGLASGTGYGIQTAAHSAAELQVPSVAFDVLNSRADGTLVASWDPATGIPRFL